MNFIKMILVLCAIFITQYSLCTFQKRSSVVVVPLIKEVVTKKSRGEVGYRAAYTFCFQQKMDSDRREFTGLSTEINQDFLYQL